MMDRMAKLMCPVCEAGELREVRKATCLEFRNPGQIVVEAKVRECSLCGETFLDEKQSAAFARKADKLYARKDKAKRIAVHEGDILLL